MTAEHTTCTVENCDNPAFCRQLCKGHYNRFNRGGDVRADVPLRAYTFKPKPKTRRRRPVHDESPNALTGGRWVPTGHGTQRWEESA